MHVAHSGGWGGDATGDTEWPTHLDTSAMCMCRSSTHRSSSSSSSTAFSRASLSPVVSYLRDTEGQGKQPRRDGGADAPGVSVPGFCVLVRVLFDVQQVIGHRLEGEFMQQWGHGVRPPVHDE